MCHSTWISSIAYRSLPDGSAYLAIFPRDNSHALLYGPNTPSYLPGLLAAGTGKRSIGLAYNRLLKGKYSYQRIEGESAIAQLKAMLNSKETPC